jgi:aryl-alcohol dehydrogenase-like predicted oxidoreductase
MLMRKLGRTGLRVAALCLGGNTFGWTTDQKTSEAVLDAYLEAGGNFIDTADVYARWAPGNKGGESEEALGTWMSARRNRSAVLIATKVMGPMGPGPNDTGLSRHHIVEGVEASLRRLQTDYIDLYQAHWDDRETPLDETLRAFDDLVSQGKVRYLGASNYQAWRLTAPSGRATSAASSATSRSSRSTTWSSATSTSASSSRSASNRAWASSPTPRSAAASSRASIAAARISPPPRARAACRRAT